MKNITATIKDDLVYRQGVRRGYVKALWVLFLFAVVPVTMVVLKVLKFY